MAGANQPNQNLNSLVEKIFSDNITEILRIEEFYLRRGGEALINLRREEFQRPNSIANQLPWLDYIPSISQTTQETASILVDAFEYYEPLARRNINFPEPFWVNGRNYNLDHLMLILNQLPNFLKKQFIKVLMVYEANRRVRNLLVQPMISVINDPGTGAVLEFTLSDDDGNGRTIMVNAAHVFSDYPIEGLLDPNWELYILRISSHFQHELFHFAIDGITRSTLTTHLTSNGLTTDNYNYDYNRIWIVRVQDILNYAVNNAMEPVYLNTDQYRLNDSIGRLNLLFDRLVQYPSIQFALFVEQEIIDEANRTIIPGDTITEARDRVRNSEDNPLRYTDETKKANFVLKLIRGLLAKIGTYTNMPSYQNAFTGTSSGLNEEQIRMRFSLLREELTACIMEYLGPVDPVTRSLPIGYIEGMYDYANRRNIYARLTPNVVESYGQVVFAGLRALDEDYSKLMKELMLFMVRFLGVFAELGQEAIENLIRNPYVLFTTTETLMNNRAIYIMPTGEVNEERGVSQIIALNQVDLDQPPLSVASTSSSQIGNHARAIVYLNRPFTIATLRVINGYCQHMLSSTQSEPHQRKKRDIEEAEACEWVKSSFHGMIKGLIVANQLQFFQTFNVHELLRKVNMPENEQTQMLASIRSTHIFLENFLLTLIGTTNKISLPAAKALLQALNIPLRSLKMDSETQYNSASFHDLVDARLKIILDALKDAKANDHFVIENSIYSEFLFGEVFPDHGDSYWRSYSEIVGKQRHVIGQLATNTEFLKELKTRNDYNLDLADYQPENKKEITDYTLENPNFGSFLEQLRQESLSIISCNVSLFSMDAQGVGAFDVLDVVRILKRGGNNSKKPDIGYYYSVLIENNLVPPKISEAMRNSHLGVGTEILERRARLIPLIAAPTVFFAAKVAIKVAATAAFMLTSYFVGKKLFGQDDTKADEIEKANQLSEESKRKGNSPQQVQNQIETPATNLSENPSNQELGRKLFVTSCFAYNIVNNFLIPHIPNAEARKAFLNTIPLAKLIKYGNSRAYLTYENGNIILNDPSKITNTKAGGLCELPIDLPLSVLLPTDLTGSNIPFEISPFNDRLQANLALSINEMYLTELKIFLLYLIKTDNIQTEFEMVLNYFQTKRAIVEIVELDTNDATVSDIEKNIRYNPKKNMVQIDPSFITNIRTYIKNRIDGENADEAVWVQARAVFNRMLVELPYYVLSLTLGTENISKLFHLNLSPEQILNRYWVLLDQVLLPEQKEGLANVFSGSKFQYNAQTGVDGYLSYLEDQKTQIDRVLEKGNISIKDLSLVDLDLFTHLTTKIGLSDEKKKSILLAIDTHSNQKKQWENILNNIYENFNEPLYLSGFFDPAKYDLLTVKKLLESQTTDQRNAMNNYVKDKTDYVFKDPEQDKQLTFFSSSSDIWSNVKPSEQSSAALMDPPHHALYKVAPLTAILDYQNIENQNDISADRRPRRNLDTSVPQSTHDNIMYYPLTVPPILKVVDNNLFVNYEAANGLSPLVFIPESAYTSSEKPVGTGLYQSIVLEPLSRITRYTWEGPDLVIIGETQDQNTICFRFENFQNVKLSPATTLKVKNTEANQQDIRLRQIAAGRKSNEEKYLNWLLEQQNTPHLNATTDYDTDWEEELKTRAFRKEIDQKKKGFEKRVYKNESISCDPSCLLPNIDITSDDAITPIYLRGASNVMDIRRFGSYFELYRDGKDLIIVYKKLLPASMHDKLVKVYVIRNFEDQVAGKSLKIEGERKYIHSIEYYDIQITAESLKNLQPYSDYLMKEALRKNQANTPQVIKLRPTKSVAAKKPIAKKIELDPAFIKFLSHQTENSLTFNVEGLALQHVSFIYPQNNNQPTLVLSFSDGRFLRIPNYEHNPKLIFDFGNGLEYHILPKQHYPNNATQAEEFAQEIKAAFLERQTVSTYRLDPQEEDSLIISEPKQESVPENVKIVNENGPVNNAVNSQELLVGFAPLSEQIEFPVSENIISSTWKWVKKHPILSVTSGVVAIGATSAATIYVFARSGRHGNTGPRYLPVGASNLLAAIWLQIVLLKNQITGGQTEHLSEENEQHPDEFLDALSIEDWEKENADACLDDFQDALSIEDWEKENATTAEKMNNFFEPELRINDTASIVDFCLQDFNSYLKTNVTIIKEETINQAPSEQANEFINSIKLGKAPELGNNTEISRVSGLDHHYPLAKELYQKGHIQFTQQTSAGSVAYDFKASDRNSPLDQMEGTLTAKISNNASQRTLAVPVILNIYAGSIHINVQNGFNKVENYEAFRSQIQITKSLQASCAKDGTTVFETHYHNQTKAVDGSIAASTKYSINPLEKTFKFSQMGSYTEPNGVKHQFEFSEDQNQCRSTETITLPYFDTSLPFFEQTIYLTGLDLLQGGAWGVALSPWKSAAVPTAIHLFRMGPVGYITRLPLQIMNYLSLKLLGVQEEDQATVTRTLVSIFTNTFTAPFFGGMISLGLFLENIASSIGNVLGDLLIKKYLKEDDFLRCVELFQVSNKNLSKCLSQEAIQIIPSDQEVMNILKELKTIENNHFFKIAQGIKGEEEAMVIFCYFFKAYFTNSDQGVNISELEKYAKDFIGYDKKKQTFQVHIPVLETKEKFLEACSKIKQKLQTSDNFQALATLCWLDACLVTLENGILPKKLLQLLRHKSYAPSKDVPQKPQAKPISTKKEKNDEKTNPQVANNNTDDTINSNYSNLLQQYPTTTNNQQSITSKTLRIG